MRPVSPESEARRALASRTTDAQRDAFRDTLLADLTEFRALGPSYAGALAATRAQLAAFDLLRSSIPTRSSVS